MAEGIWWLWRDGKHDPATNMARDEALLLSQPGQPVLRYYDWDAPAATIGYYQAIAEAPADRPVMRRPTGGGHVFHGQDLTYGLVLPTGSPLAQASRFASYRLIHEAISEALRVTGLQVCLAAEDQPEPGVPRSAMSCFRSPAESDILGRDGRKLAGAAQRRAKAGVLQQGSINLGSELPRATLSAAVLDAFASAFGVAFEPLPGNQITAVCEHAAVLAGEKYRTTAWAELR